MKIINPDAHVVTLGQEEEKPVYDEKLKRWVFPGDDPAELAKPLAPPPKAPIPSPAPVVPPNGGSNDPLDSLIAPPPRRNTPSSMNRVTSRSRYPDPMASMGVVSSTPLSGSKGKMPPIGAKKPPSAPPKFTVFQPKPSAEKKAEAAEEKK